MHPLITQQLNDFFTASALVTLDQCHFAVPPKPEMGDVSFPCFDAAKVAKENPAAFAQKLAEKLGEQKISLVSDVKAFGPYVNVFLDAGEVAKIVLSDIFTQKDQYGQLNIGEGKKVMIEYPSQNTHKEFHIGHLRNMCIGNSLVGLYRKVGYDMLPVNYINDFGRHVVKCLWGIQRWHEGKIPEENRQRWLGEVYADASTFLKDKGDEFNDELNALQTKLEEKDPDVYALFLETRDWSMEGFTRIHEELAADHQTTFFESDVKARGQEIVDEMLEQGIASVGERGAIIVDLNDVNLDIALVRKSFGAGLYLTSDFALWEKKCQDYDIVEAIVLTGVEQTHHFKQLFEIMRRREFTQEFVHIGYGLISVPGGKMSSREGNVVLYEDLRDTIFEQMKAETATRNEDWDEEKVAHTAHVLTQAILKFTILQHEAKKGFVFDFETALSFEGYSGPYILYVIARIESILRKAAYSEGALDVYHYTLPQEKALLLWLGQYSTVVEKAFQDRNPSVITRYVFDLAKAYNDFYQHARILDVDESTIKDARLALCAATKNVLTNALGLLTIPVLTEM